MASSGLNRVLCVGGLSAITLLLVGCDRVSVSYHHDQARHRHVWVKTYCADHDGRCNYCAGCEQYRHRKVRVHKARHTHVWAMEYCDAHHGKCRFCTGCAKVLHVEASRKIRIRKSRRRGDH